jgi:hypothetical protein
MNRRRKVALLVLTAFVLAACTSTAPASRPATTPEATATPPAPDPPAAPQPLASQPADPVLSQALLTDADVAGLGLAAPTMRGSRPYPDGLERCGRVSGGLDRPDRNESVGWTLSAPATEVVHSVSRFPAGMADKGMTQLNQIVAWCSQPDELATHRQPITLPALEQVNAAYAVCYVWLALTWCNIALRRGDVISAVRLGWGAGSKMSLATVPALAQAAAKRMAGAL